MTIAAAATADRDIVVAPRPAGRADGLEDRWLLLAAGAISGGIVAGMYVGSGLLMTVAAVAALIAGLVVPPLGLLVVAFLGPLRPPPVIPAPGFNMLLVGAILLGSVYRLPLSRNRLFVSPPLLLLCAFVLYIFVQQLPDMAAGYAGARSHDTGFLFFQLLTGLGAVVAAGFVLRGRSPYPFFVALLISATFSAILGILTGGGGGSYAQLENILSTSDIGGRATGPFGNPNAYGQFLAYGVALAAGWIASTGSYRIRTGLLVAVAIMGYAISLSLSRGAIAALLAGLVALAFARSRRVGSLAAGVALLLVVVGYPLFVQNRLTTELGSASSAAVEELNQSDEGRLDAVLAGPELFATSPIFGIGFGEYKYASASVTEQGGGLVAHNWYGTVLAEQGLLGIVLWLLMLVMVATWLRSLPARPRSFGFAMLAATVVGCLFLQPPTSFQMSVMPILVLTGVLVGDLGGSVTAAGRPERGTRPTSGHRRGPVRRQAEVVDQLTDG